MLAREQAILDGQQMLERPERHRGEREPLLEVEPAHVGLHQPCAELRTGSGSSQQTPADREHLRTQVDPDDLDAGARVGISTRPVPQPTSSTGPP